jgi:hypothetical protein
MTRAIPYQMSLVMISNLHPLFFTIYISTVQLYVNAKEEMFAPRHCSAL